MAKSTCLTCRKNQTKVTNAQTDLGSAARTLVRKETQRNYETAMRAKDVLARVRAEAARHASECAQTMEVAA